MSNDNLVEMLLESVQHNPVLRYERRESLEKTADIIRLRVSAFKGGLKEGEWVRIDGNAHRVAYVHRELGSDQYTLQFGRQGGGSYYLCSSNCSMSGSLDSTLTVSVEPTNETMQASCWIFHGGAGESRGVYFKVPMRVWEGKIVDE